MVMLLALQLSAYSEVSIRELIKWVKHIILSRTSAAQSVLDQQADVTSGTRDQGHPIPSQLLSDTAYTVYAARFRTAAAKAEITQLLTTKMRWPKPSTSSRHTTLQISTERNGRNIQLGCMSLQWRGMGNPSQDEAKLVPFNESAAILSAALAAHAAVAATACGVNFIQQHGIYSVDQTWLQHWLEQAQQQGLDDLNEVGWLGMYLYCSRLRHAGARTAVGELFVDHFGLDQSVALDVATACSGVASSRASTMLAAAAPGVQLMPISPAKPFALTPRIVKAWQFAGRSLEAAEPLLLVGRDGCGKSESLRALGLLLGMQVQHFNMTPGEFWGATSNLTSIAQTSQVGVWTVGPPAVSRNIPVTIRWCTASQESHA